MPVEQFADSVESLKDFPIKSNPPTTVETKVIGIIGGEPLLHPAFAELARVIAERIPQQKHRGLWTGLDWNKGPYASLIRDTFGYVNNNQHNTECLHSPVLLAIKDVVANPGKRRRLIDDCWLQQLWSSSITPKGFFFCEVAGAMDWVFDGPGGLPIETDCWKRPLSDFRSQINCWCQRCGIPLNLKGRRDIEQIDDLSASNLVALQDSPAVQVGRYILHDRLPSEIIAQPWRYLQ